ncbi:hypothetical protein FHR22_004100 [Sphingopyxis panaciterrae]|uniref:hypothetical protein n=1 Tax=Sphingopyxis panaciterrae TaxID=363841 RepID=UPI00141FD901|nr:hypothetical protein [Sphingopyxis panaciterrae]NIJ39353.1 hypothetical protein [Sphingopyxis panaciterrae]
MRFHFAIASVILAASAAPAAATQVTEAPAAAALARPPVEGEVLRDTKARIVGKVYKVQPSGAILAIVHRETVRIPAETLSIVDGKLVTTLTKSEALKRK